MLAAGLGDQPVYAPGLDPATTLLTQPWEFEVGNVTTGSMKFRGFKHDLPGDWTALDTDLSSTTATITFEGSALPIPNEPTSFGKVKSLFSRE